MKYILLVEDDTALREGLVTALQNDTISVHSAANLAEARKILRNHTFDLLLLDVNLPDGSGIELCREVTAVQDVPVIFLTVRDAEIDEVTAFRAGACDYIMLPRISERICISQSAVMISSISPASASVFPKGSIIAELPPYTVLPTVLQSTVPQELQQTTNI